MNEPKTVVPVDNRNVSEVTKEQWDSDHSLSRFYNMVNADPAAKSRFDAALAEIRVRQATLTQVRKAQQFTQTRMGELLEMSQSEVSRLERRSDMLLSTLRSYVQAAGGELELVATFPESGPVSLLIGERALMSATKG